MLPVLVLVLSVSGAVVGDDWPGFGGPAHDGVSRETGWSAEGKPLWSARIGIGYSSFAVQGGRVYTLGYDRLRETDLVYCFDAETGKELWTHACAVEVPNHDERESYLGTLTTPAVEGEFVYCSEREGTLRCLKSADGALVWERKAEKELKLDRPTYGFAASPIVLGEQLILNYGRVVAFDKKSGATVWRSKKNYGDAYSTPVDFTLDEKRWLAVFAGDGLAILSAEDGRERGFYAWKTRDDVNAMTPVVLGSRVFVSSGYDHGCALLDVAGPRPKLLWESKVMRNQDSGARAWQEHLFGFDAGVLTCIDLEGKVCWNQRGINGAALAIADGRLIFVEAEGALVVAEASHEAYRELARAHVLEPGGFKILPVLSDGRIFVRNLSGQVVARDHRGR